MFFYSQFENTDKNIISNIDLIGTDNTKNWLFIIYKYIIAFEMHYHIITWNYICYNFYLKFRY